MSTSILYHGFGLAGYKYLRSFYDNGVITFSIEQNRKELVCPDCRSNNVSKKGTFPRIIQTLPIGMKKVFLKLEVQRIYCKDCGCIKQVKIGFADERNRYSRQLERFAVELSFKMSISDVSKFLGLGWDTIKDMQKEYLRKHYSNPALKDVEFIAIDEIAIGQGHNYLTVVMDLDSGAIIFAGDGKGTKALETFWKRLRKSNAEISAVAIDMSPAYRKAVEDNLPNATIIYDHFHIVKAFNDGLSNFRRELYGMLSNQNEKRILKGTRWLLLKNPENLDEEKNEKEKLNLALEMNRPLATAYYMKEELRQIWHQSNKAAAMTKIKEWMGMAKNSGIRMLEKFAETIANHMAGILSWYDVDISTGPLEATNNKIKYLLRQAFGFRDLEYFKLKIYALHEARYALIG